MLLVWRDQWHGNKSRRRGAMKELAFLTVASLLQGAEATSEGNLPA
jgi:hypothetical protein